MSEIIPPSDTNSADQESSPPFVVPKLVPGSVERQLKEWLRSVGFDPDVDAEKLPEPETSARVFRLAKAIDRRYELNKFTVLDSAKYPILYHYCSVDSFISILKNKNLRLSDISTMNDYAELKWAKERFFEAMTALELPRVDAFSKFNDDLISQAASRLPLVFCFSKEGDVLSQWRAYAANASGVSIGFDAEKVRQLAAYLGNISYSKEEQIAHYRDIILCALIVMTSSHHLDRLKDGLQAYGNVVVMSLSIIGSLMKNSAFEEEKEVRIIRLALIKQLEDGNTTLVDAGGKNDDEASSRPMDMQFRERNGAIIPFIELPVSGLGPELIKEVVIGPRCPSTEQQVSAALSAQGYTGFKIRRSLATYR